MKVSVWAVSNGMKHVEPIGTEELFRRHAPFVARFVTRVGAHPQDVEDVVQEVFVTAHRRGGYLPGAASPTTWLANIALGVLSTRRRTRARHPEDITDEPGATAIASGVSPAEAIEVREAYERVQQALSRLDPDRRAVFVLFELEEQPCDEIAAGLGVPIGTVYSRLHAARKEFSAAIERGRIAERAAPRAARVGGA